LLASRRPTLSCPGRTWCPPRTARWPPLGTAIRGRTCRVSRSDDHVAPGFDIVFLSWSRINPEIAVSDQGSTRIQVRAGDRGYSHVLMNLVHCGRSPSEHPANSQVGMPARPAIFGRPATGRPFFHQRPDRRMNPPGTPLLAALGVPGGWRGDGSTGAMSLMLHYRRVRPAFPRRSAVPHGERPRRITACRDISQSARQARDRSLVPHSHVRVCTRSRPRSSR